MAGAVGRALSGVVVVVMAAIGLIAPAAPAAAVTPCSRGIVGLTFDDGPRATTTALVLDALAARRVKATFFVVGQNVAARPSLVRRQHNEGHVVANHTWAHENLTRLSNTQIRDTIRRTNRAVTDRGLPAPRLVRPPYGATSQRVRDVIADLGMTHTLWTVDPQDWRSGRSASTIADLTLRGLAPGAVVVMHDGVANSTNTARALPTIIDTARARGYCFGVLGTNGKPMPPKPAISVANISVAENAGKAVFTVKLSEPTSRKVTVAYATADGTAKAGADYTARSGTLTFDVGQVRKTVSVSIANDRLDENDESFSLQLSKPGNATIGRGKAKATIVDDDPAPALAAADATVAEGPAGATTPAVVTVRLSAPSGKRVEVAYSTVDGTAKAGTDYTATSGTLVFRPGRTKATVTVPVLGNDTAQPDRALSVRLSSPVNATFERRTAKLVILDDDPPPEPTVQANQTDEEAREEADAPDGAAGDAPDGAPGGTPDGAPGAAPQEAPDDAPDDATDEA